MLNEKHSDPFSWKNKLEGLTALPGEATLEKNKAWEKLSGRLQQKPRRNKAIWYWAAASIMLACIIPLMLTNKTGHMVVKHDPVQKQHTVTTAEQLQTIRAAPVVVKPPVQAEKIEVEKNTTKDKPITNLAPLVKQGEPVIAIAETPAEKDPLITIIPALGIDTAATVATVVPVKKKLAIVHINEVDAPAVQVFPPSSYVQRSIRIKLGNKKGLSQNIASQQQYKDGFKIKLSSKN